MSEITIKAGGKSYGIDPDKLTLGEARVLKRDYGMKTLGQLNFGDPDQMVGILTIAIMREDTDAKKADVEASVEAMDFIEVMESMESEDEPEENETADPQAAADAATGNGGNAAAGKRATRQKSGGRRR